MVLGMNTGEKIKITISYMCLMKIEEDLDRLEEEIRNRSFSTQFIYSKGSHVESFIQMSDSLKSMGEEFSELVGRTRQKVSLVREEYQKMEAKLVRELFGI